MSGVLKVSSTLVRFVRPILRHGRNSRLPSALTSWLIPQFFIVFISLNCEAQSVPSYTFDPKEDGALYRLNADQVVQISNVGTGVIPTVAAYKVQGPKTVMSSPFIPVTPEGQYHLSGLFRSGTLTQSRLYFGISTYDEKGNFISAVEVLRVGSDNKIRSISNNVITVEGRLSGWNAPNAEEYLKRVGFYYDGNTNKRPDYVTPGTTGAYSEITDRTIRLPAPLPGSVLAKIVPGVTVVKNHYSGSTYMYSAASAKLADSAQWSFFSSPIISGEGFGNGRDMFRIGTRYIKIVILANHKQSQNEVLYFRNINFNQRSGVTAADTQPSGYPYARISARDGNLIGADGIRKGFLGGEGGREVFWDAGSRVFALPTSRDKAGKPLFGLIPVTPGNTYDFSAAFRAEGTGWRYVYLGFELFNKWGSRISSAEFDRLGAYRVLSATANQIRVAGDYAFGKSVGYSSPYVQPDCSRFLGFYFDGNTDKRPDTLLGQCTGSRSPSSGAYSGGAYDEATGLGTLFLNTHLSSSVLQKITAATVVMFHRVPQGLSENYYFNSSFSISSNESRVHALLSGKERMPPRYGDRELFPPNVRFVRPIIFVAQDEAQQLEYDALKFRQLSGNKSAHDKGDINGDRCVTGGDVSIFLGQYERCGANQTADFNGDTCVTAADAGILSANYGQCF
ncbi:MAG: hypothetical protein WD851_15490 [Pirellulales bacterium]